MTVVLAGTASGDFLPAQLIYSGTTMKCLPRSVRFPGEWHITSTPTHWSNEDTMIDYLNKIIVPHFAIKRMELKLPNTFPALVLFDHFSGQVTQSIFDKLNEHYIMFVLIPKTCTDRLQPMDLSINKPIKDCLKASFQNYYACEIQKQIKKNPDSTLTPIDLRLSTIKPLHAHWIIDTYHYVKSKPELFEMDLRQLELLTSQIIINTLTMINVN